MKFLYKLHAGTNFVFLPFFHFFFSFFLSFFFLFSFSLSSAEHPFAYLSITQALVTSWTSGGVTNSQWSVTFGNTKASSRLEDSIWQVSFTADVTPTQYLNIEPVTEKKEKEKKTNMKESQPANGALPLETLRPLPASKTRFGRCRLLLTSLLRNIGTLNR